VGGAARAAHGGTGGEAADRQRHQRKVGQGITPRPHLWRGAAPRRSACSAGVHRCPRGAGLMPRARSGRIASEPARS
jgi:hypothetical protein